MNPRRLKCKHGASAGEERAVERFLALRRRGGWLAHYVDGILADFADGKPPSPLALVIDAKRAEEQHSHRARRVA